MSLFAEEPAYQPLAARLRPRTLDEVVGQSHLLAPGKPLSNAIRQSQLHSMILWGPPGTGKTTLAQLIAAECDVHFLALSAVLSGVRDIRDAVAEARQHQQMGGKRTLLFVDEVHRFNKSQQDAFLPHVEDGTVVFVGATTENPSFELNNALLSRARVYRLQALTVDEISLILRRALTAMSLTMDDDLLGKLAAYADGDARRALNLLEVCGDLADGGAITAATLAEIMGGDYRQFDKGGDLFYEQISALHKAVRGSDPDGALYWYARMLDGGCDPFYIARRVVRMASEDIGNADPRALQLTLNAWDVQQRLGSPEGELAIAQAVVYLAVAAKSNAAYAAFGQAMTAARESGSLDVPLHIRNAPTDLMKEMGYGDDYRYAHDFADAFVPGESYLPEALAGQQFYHPTDRGLEKQIRDKLTYLREQNRSSDFQRYPNGGEGKPEGSA